ncbi:MAG TPA: GNAT family N-acetyltransferase [Afifellaceae bacterium]|nr:GNAT family N-acetyltransferase [Afifellaceae bacterium]
MAEIDRAAWNACANPGAASRNGCGELAADREETAFNPFISWDFLQALEESGCVSARTGWLPRHLVLEEDEAVVAAAPCYLKSHSRGEYVFDYGWAEAFEYAGGRYYPKLQVAVPFTPVPGRRLLTPPGPDAGDRRRLLAAALAELCRRQKASSVHLTFISDAESRLLGEMGLLERTDRQFHWLDRGYGTFDGFLAALASRKRKAIRKERREAVAAGIEIEWLTGSAITEGHWDAFFAFYIDTGSRKWGQPYLNRRFFSLLGERMGDVVALVMARRGGRPVAGALNLIGSDTLYGRYWGCTEDHPYLHFEVCYYQAIEFALAHGLARVEAGAQGAHKLARGYEPVITRSAHFIADPRLRRAVADYLDEERRHVELEARVLAEHAPFRRGGAPLDRGGAG